MCSILVLNGNQDIIANPVDNRYALGAEGPLRRRFTCSPDAAHGSLHQFPERTAEEVNSFPSGRTAADRVGCCRLTSARPTIITRVKPWTLVERHRTATPRVCRRRRAGSWCGSCLHRANDHHKNQVFVRARHHPVEEIVRGGDARDRGHLPALRSSRAREADRERGHVRAGRIRPEDRTSPRSSQSSSSLIRGSTQRLAGIPIESRFDLFGNATIAQGLFRHAATAGLGAPVRFCVSQRDGEDTRIDIDLPTAFFSQFPELRESKVPEELDARMIPLLEKIAG